MIYKSYLIEEDINLLKKKNCFILWGKFRLKNRFKK